MNYIILVVGLTSRVRIPIPFMRGSQQFLLTQGIVTTQCESQSTGPQSTNLPLGESQADY